MSRAFENRKVTTGSVDGWFAEVAEHVVIAICAPAHAHALQARGGGLGIGVQTETSKMARFFQIVQDAVFPDSKPCIGGAQRLKLDFPAGKPYGEAPASRLKKNPA